MNIQPDFIQITNSICGERNVGKWYCAYHEEQDGRRIARYLHPTGWHKNAYWWDSKEEAEKAFASVGQKKLPISDRELADAKMVQADYAWLNSMEEREIKTKSTY